MAGKVLLGLLAAAAVTGSAVVFSGGSKTGCPLSAATCDAGTTATSCPGAEEATSCCATKSRAGFVCCDGMSEELANTGDAIAAATGGVCLVK